MKKITILICAIIAFNYINAQNSCLSAFSVSEGITSVGTINGDSPTLICDSKATSTKGMWYSYTASADGYAKISTYLPSNSGADTNMFVYAGDCGALECLASSDDISSSIYTSQVYIPITNGEVYYIAFDNRWSASGFDFEITETSVNCTNGSLPFNEDFSDWSSILACWKSIDSNLDNYKWVLQDLDGGNLSLVSESYSPTSSNPNGFLNPDNWIVSYPIDLSSFNTNYNIELKWKARGVNSGLANENYSVYVATGDEISDFESSPVMFNEIIGQNGGAGSYANKSLDISSLAGNMVYVAFRHHNMSEAQYKLSIDDIEISSSLLGVNETSNSDFKHYYNPTNEFLTLKSDNSPIDKMELYNILGENLITRQISNVRYNLDMTSFTDGIYIIQIQIKDTIKTLKFIKH